MHFYSGFCLRNDAGFFEGWLKKDVYTVAGFSYGAIKAFRHVLASERRIDTLQLFSPAFFRDRTESFRRLQMKGYQRDGVGYRARFLESCFSPYPVGTVETADDGAEALEALLTFDWPTASLAALKVRGVRIEVYLGEKDAVVDTEAAMAYFRPFATVFYFKGANHFLQGA